MEPVFYCLSPPKGQSLSRRICAEGQPTAADSGSNQLTADIYDSIVEVY